MGSLMKTSNLFADHWRWWFMRFFSQQGLERWFSKRSGGEPVAFAYSNSLKKARNRLFILPDQLSQFAVFLPLVTYLIENQPEDAQQVFISDHRFLPILKLLDLQKHFYFYNQPSLRYGTSEFIHLENVIQSHRWDACFLLQHEPNLLLQYLAKKTQAPYRVGLHCDKLFPFLNISLSSTPLYNPYQSLKQVLKQLEIPQTCLQKAFRHDDTKLSSENVILLNLDPPLKGEGWSQAELECLISALDPHQRFLAISSHEGYSAPFAAFFEKKGIRIAATGSSYHAFFDQIKQYRGMVSLLGNHASLAANLSDCPILMFRNDLDWTIPRHLTNLKIEDRLKLNASNSDRISALLSELRPSPGKKHKS